MDHMHIQHVLQPQVRVVVQPVTPAGRTAHRILAILAEFNAVRVSIQPKRTVLALVSASS